MAGTPARLFADGGVADRLGLSSWAAAAAAAAESSSQPRRKALAHLIAPSIKTKRTDLEDKCEHTLHTHRNFHA